jgi:hypothetical protein
MALKKTYESIEGNGIQAFDVISPSNVPNQSQTMDTETLNECLPSNVARIFISHKAEDTIIAKSLRDILKKFDDDEDEKLEFCISEEIPGGKKCINGSERTLGHLIF